MWPPFKVLIDRYLVNVKGQRPYEKQGLAALAICCTNIFIRCQVAQSIKIFSCLLKATFENCLAKNEMNNDLEIAFANRCVSE